ncbi:MAG: CHASE3 domain-containing protein [Burkholderiaceae bacterium]
MIFPLACVVAAAIVLVSETTYWQSVERLQRVNALTKSQDSLQRLTQGIVDAETGTRGFLLTGGPEYLEPYHAALGKITLAMQQVDQRFSTDPASAELLEKLHEFTRSKLSELQLTIQLVEEGKAGATSEILKSGIGKEKMDEIRAINTELLAREERNIRQGREGIYRTLSLSRIGIILLSLSGLLVLFLYQRQTVALKLQQLEQQRMVQAERDRLEVEVIERTAQLTELTQHIQTAREDERHRLARNLHDDLGALLTSAKLDAARIRSRISATAPEALDLLAHLVITLNSGIALGRRIIEDLRPSALSNLGLVATLEIQAREFSENTGVKVACSLEPVELEPASELIAYRLVQEAITNIAKYAQASQVWIRLASHGKMVEVSVRDDGAGFDPQVKRTSAYGLVGMRFRVEACGGRLTIKSAPGQGTEIRAMLPEKSVLEPLAAS